MRPIRLVAIVLTLAFLTLGCDRYHRWDDGSFFLYIEGSWGGSVHDSVCGDGTITFVFIQSGNRVSGTWRIVFSGTTNPRCYDPASPSRDLSGPVSGNVNGGTVGLTLQRPQGSVGCPFTQPISLTGTWTGNRFTAAYSGVSCDGGVTGTVDARR